MSTVKPKSNQPNIDRKEMAVQLRESGWTFKKIGDYLGVTQSRASQLNAAGKRRRDEMGDPLAELPAGPVNAMRSNGLKSREEMVNAIQTGRITMRGRRVRLDGEQTWNLGPKRLLAITQALGLTEADINKTPVPPKHYQQKTIKFAISLLRNLGYEVRPPDGAGSKQ